MVLGSLINCTFPMYHEINIIININQYVLQVPITYIDKVNLIMLGMNIIIVKLNIARFGNTNNK